MERKALGRGLNALIPETTAAKKEGVIYLKAGEVKSSRYQPREAFDLSKQKELEASIKEKGVVQPILVRPWKDGYELIAGERRLRAVKALGITEVPAIVKDVNDAEALELALIENIQREALNPIEEAHAYKKLIEEFEFTQDKVAQAVGKDRATVANSLRLLNLSSKIQELISQGKISAGHARAILSVEGTKSQNLLCDTILRKGLSVREAENLARKTIIKKKKAPAQRDAHLVSIEEELQRHLGTRVKIIPKKKRGKIIIEYYSHEDFDRLIAVLKLK